jgi:hypothetical protein
MSVPLPRISSVTYDTRTVQIKRMPLQTPTQEIMIQKRNEEEKDDGKQKEERRKSVTPMIQNVTNWFRE